MPYHKLPPHANQARRCPDCRRDSIKYVQTADSWICSHCAHAIREEYLQTALPSSRELDTDDVDADNQVTRREPLYMKSIQQRPSEYEDSVYHNLEDRDVKYTGSAGSAILQDNIRRDYELAKARRFEQ